MPRTGTPTSGEYHSSLDIGGLTPDEFAHIHSMAEMIEYGKGNLDMMRGEQSGGTSCAPAEECNEVHWARYEAMQRRLGAARDGECVPVDHLVDATRYMVVGQDSRLNCRRVDITVRAGVIPRTGDWYVVGLSVSPGGPRPGYGPKRYFSFDEVAEALDRLPKGHIDREFYERLHADDAAVHEWFTMENVLIEDGQDPFDLIDGPWHRRIAS